MARKKKQKTGDRRRERDLNNRPDVAHWEVAPETRDGIVVVLTFALAIILGLGLAGLAGNLGAIITTLLQYLFCQAAWLLPITIGLFSLLYLRRLTGDFRLINAFGLFLLMICGVGLTQLADNASGGLREVKVEAVKANQQKVGRNDPCPCGSGKKYKLCHGKV